MQKWASSTACKEQCEKHWRGDAHGVEAMGGEGATITLARPCGTFHPRNSRRGPTSLPQPCPNTNPADGQLLRGTGASEPPGHGCGSHQRGQSLPREGDGPPMVQAAGEALSSLHKGFAPRRGKAATGAAGQPHPSYAQPHGGLPEGTTMPCQGHRPRDHCTLSQDNKARVPPEQQRAQTDEKKEGRRNAR